MRARIPWLIRRLSFTTAGKVGMDSNMNDFARLRNLDLIS